LEAIVHTKNTSPQYYLLQELNDLTPLSLFYSEIIVTAIPQIKTSFIGMGLIFVHYLFILLNNPNEALVTSIFLGFLSHYPVFFQEFWNLRSFLDFFFWQ